MRRKKSFPPDWGKSCGDTATLLATVSHHHYNACIGGGYVQISICVVVCRTLLRAQHPHRSVRICVRTAPCVVHGDVGHGRIEARPRRSGGRGGVPAATITTTAARARGRSGSRSEGKIAAIEHAVSELSRVSKGVVRGNGEMSGEGKVTAVAVRGMDGSAGVLYLRGSHWSWNLLLPRSGMDLMWIKLEVCSAETVHIRFKPNIPIDGLRGRG